jgi:nucleoside-diphosphate-sugar epimerase
MKRVLVLGAGGFVGRRVVEALAETGWAQPIAGLHRARPPFGSGVATTTVDSTDPGAISRALSETEFVVNCVTGDARTISVGARRLFEGAARLDALERIVHLSSMAVYGAATGRVRETAALAGDLGWYAAAKVQAEESARAYTRGGGRVVTLRPGCIYGPESDAWTGRIGRWLRAGRIGDLGASGDGICNLVLVDDVVAAVIAALQEPAADGQAINLAHPAGTWNRYFVRFARAIGSTPVRRISGRRLRLETKVLAPALAIAGIGARRLGAGRLRLPEPIPPSLVRLWQQDIELDSTKAEELLRIAWTPIERGLEVSARWFTRADPRRSRSGGSSATPPEA